MLCANNNRTRTFFYHLKAYAVEKITVLIVKQALMFGAGIAAEYVVTSLVETVRGRFRGDQDRSNEQRLSVLDAELNGLKKHAIEMHEIQRAQNNAMKMLAQQVSTNTKRISELARSYPQQSSHSLRTIRHTTCLR